MEYGRGVPGAVSIGCLRAVSRQGALLEYFDIVCTACIRSRSARHDTEL